MQEYATHVVNLWERAAPALEAMLAHYTGGVAALPSRLRSALPWSTTFHDLGKVEDENWKVLSGITGQALPYPHESAGALHCLQRGQTAAAFAIHSHHQGLTNDTVEREQWRLGEKRGASKPFIREGQYSQTAALLPTLLTRHEEALGHQAISLSDDAVQVCRWIEGNKRRKSHLSTLEMRLLLSLLVDADHGDTAHHYGQEVRVAAPAPRWQERLKKLEKHVAELGSKEVELEGPRDPFRRRVYGDCLEADPQQHIYVCDAPVGSGKTTAVMAYLLQAAIKLKLRRIFVVLPFTNIIQQSVNTYRDALVLDGEDPEQVVAENHHAAEFQSPGARALTTLWKAPIVVTTAVQFFETLAANMPARLRKLHALPGSAVFIDEAHAAMPLHLWPSMWDRLDELSRNWSCRFVLGSGSLPRFWENTRLFPTPVAPPSTMLCSETVCKGAVGETKRVKFLTRPETQSLASLVEWIRELKGSRLVVMNTVQSAAALARELRKEQVSVLHLSTALTPTDRERVLEKARTLLTPGKQPASGWVMVATSCIEAGVDISFDIALRERSSVASLIQIGGRVNRNGNGAQAEVWDFTAQDPLFVRNRALEHSIEVVRKAFEHDWLKRPASEAMTTAIGEEFKRQSKREDVEELCNAEKNWEFVTVAKLSRLIDDDSVTVVVDRALIAKLERGEHVSHVQLVRGSVALRRNVADLVAQKRPFKKIRDDNLYVWPDEAYDSELLGIMQYLLSLKDIDLAKCAML